MTTDKRDKKNGNSELTAEETSVDPLSEVISAEVKPADFKVSADTIKLVNQEIADLEGAQDVRQSVLSIEFSL